MVPPALGVPPGPHQDAVVPDRVHPLDHKVTTELRHRRHVGEGHRMEMGVHRLGFLPGGEALPDPGGPIEEDALRAVPDHGLGKAQGEVRLASWLSK
jgi:hypothetical protein